MIQFWAETDFTSISAKDKCRLNSVWYKDASRNILRTRAEFCKEVGRET